MTPSKTVLKHLSAKPANILVPALLFFFFSPGVLFNVKVDIPLISNIPILKDFPSHVLHTFIFAIVYFLIYISFPQYY